MGRQHDGARHDGLFHEVAGDLVLGNVKGKLLTLGVLLLAACQEATPGLATANVRPDGRAGASVSVAEVGGSAPVRVVAPPPIAKDTNAAEGLDGEPRAQAEPSPEYNVAGHRIRLLVENGACAVAHRAGTEVPTKITLDLSPPCYLLLWQRKPPTRVASATPVGSVGQPMAWRFADEQGIVAVGIIGDVFTQAMRSSSLFRLREQQGLTCAPSTQALLMGERELRSSRKRDHIGVLCSELGIEEKDFWRYVHD
ncbi:MAG: hypothetical protein JWN04_5959 [Myxococcaceae bacterium]|nr:hypothetical protein [Myxococcaceae bacterium]